MLSPLSMTPQPDWVMNEAEALEAIQSAAQWWFSDHAYFDRMKARRISRADVKHAIASATTCAATTTSQGPAWIVTGPDQDEEPIRVIIALEPLPGAGWRNIVITVTGP